MAFFGMRGTGDWADNERPENWRETILYLYPNGTAPLTAMLSMLGSESTNDPKFHWWTKGLPKQGGEAIGVFADEDLQNAVTGTPEAGDMLYIQAPEDIVAEFRIGHTALIAEQDTAVEYAIGKVIERALNGASSYVRIDILKDSSFEVENTNVVFVSGNVNAEGVEMPDNIHYDPVQFTNVTQIFRTPLRITRTARKTRLRTKASYEEQKREALELHAMEMEDAFLTGVMSENTGENGKPERTTQGIITTIKEYFPDNIHTFHTDPDYAGEEWATSSGGEDWLNETLGQAFIYGSRDKLGLCGNRAITAINKLVRENASYQIFSREAAYGIEVKEWVTPHGTVYLKTHPRFNHRDFRSRDILLIEPERLKFRYIDDTFFVDDPEDQMNRNNSKDATEEEFITEAGLEWHHPEVFHYFSGLGRDNELT